MRPAGFEHAIPASQWPQLYSLDLAATGIGSLVFDRCYNLPPDEAVRNKIPVFLRGTADDRVNLLKPSGNFTYHWV
jgi:hypothetical protein